MRSCRFMAVLPTGAGLLAAGILPASPAQAAWSAPISVNAPGNLTTDSAGNLYAAASPAGGGGSNGGGGNKGGKKHRHHNHLKNPKITKVKIDPKASWIYADNYLNMKVAVTNKGKEAARMVYVTFDASISEVKPPKSITIKRIKPGWTDTKSIKVRAKRRATKWKSVRIYAHAAGKTGKARLKIIRPWW